METSFFFIDIYTIIIDIMLFLVVIFVFGGFFEFLLSKIFQIDKFYKKIPLLIKINIKMLLGISLILVFSSLASLFSILNQLYVLLVTITILVGYFLLLVRNMKSYEFKWNQNLTKILPVIGVLILGSVLRLLTMSLDGIVFPGDDVKFHSMFVELICLNNGFGETFEPFVHQIAAYPPGFHMVVAFFSMMFGQLSTKVLTVFTCFVYGLVGLSFYSLAYALSKSEIASFVSVLSVLFLNGEISLISLWGGTTLLMAFFLTSTFLAVIYFDDAKFNGFFRCIAGIAFITAFITNTGLALMGFIFLVPFILRKAVTKKANTQMIKKYVRFKFSLFLFLSCVYFLIILPLILPSIKFVLGLAPPDLIVSQVPTGIRTYGADWYYLQNFIPRVVLNHGIFMAIILVSSILLFATLLYVRTHLDKTRNFQFKATLFSYSCIFSWIFILILFGVNNPKGVFFVEFPLWDLFVPSRIFTFLLLPLCILTGLLFQSVFDGLKHLCVTGSCVRAKYVVIAIFLALSISICYIDIKTNQSTESVGTSRIAISITDLECFEWIIKNTKMEDKFLVETSDAGQYISSFCDRTVIYPFTLMQFDSNYVDLKNYLYTDPDGTQALNLLSKLEVDYVFVGSKTDWWTAANTTFNADLLLASLHYKLAFNSSGSFIFKVELEASD